MPHWKLKYYLVLISVLSASALQIPLERYLLHADEVPDIRPFEGTYVLGEDCWLTTISLPKESGELQAILFPRPRDHLLFEGELVPVSLPWTCKPTYLRPLPDLSLFEKPVELILVQWGERRYLISEQQLYGNNPRLHFCQAIKSDYEPRISPYGSFYLMDGHWNKPVYGEPHTVWGKAICDSQDDTTPASLAKHSY